MPHYPARNSTLSTNMASGATEAARRHRPHAAHFLICTFLMVSSLGCLPCLKAASPEWAPVSAAELADNTPHLEPSAGVEILNYRVEIDDREAPGRKVLRQVRFKIYDPSRAFEATRLSSLLLTGAQWSNDDKIDIEARLTLPDGTVRHFGRADLRSRSIAKEGRANGVLGFLSASTWQAEEKFLAITGVVRGAILDIWEWRPNGGIAGWSAMPVQRREIPIRNFEYINRFRYDPNTYHRLYVLNPNGGKLDHDEKKGVIHFEAKNLASLPEEPMAAPETYYSLTIVEADEHMQVDLGRRHVYRVPLPKDVPASLGPWAFMSTTEDFYDADEGYVTKSVKKKAGELIAGAANDREKARRIFEFVRSLYQRFQTRADLENWYTRYVESVDELIDLDKIDSTVIRVEDFHYLLIALLRAAGLECHSAFSPNRTAFQFTPALVARPFINFKSVAVNVDGNWELCDPCSKLPMAFGERPWIIENQPTLVALPQKQTFLFVPPTPAERSVAETKADVEMDSAGNIQGECVRTFTGHEAEVMRNTLDRQRRENWWKLARTIFDCNDSSAEPRLISVEGQDKPDEPLRIKADVRWPAYAALVDDRMLFIPELFCGEKPPLLSATVRKTPVFFDYPSTQRDVITIKLPKGYRPGPMVRPFTHQSDQFAYTYSVKYDANAGTLQIFREWVNRAVEIPVNQYPEALRWFSLVCASDHIPVTLRPIKLKP